jgi:parallel beta-helix repeat protein
MNKMSLLTVSFSLLVTIFLILAFPIAIENSTSSITSRPIVPYAYAQNDDATDIPMQQDQVNSSSYPADSMLYDGGCVYYDKANRTIHICGGSTNLSTIDQVVNSSDVLNQTSNKNWILNANVSVEYGASLFINSTDAKWLRIKSSPDYPHSIVVYGNLIIDGSKISSWNPTNITEAAMKSNTNVSLPRGYLLVPQQGTGHMNITGSDISGLGFKSPRDTWGITYYSGSGSVIENNTISSNFRGLHLAGNVSNILVANNTIQNSSQHGLDLLRVNDVQVVGNNVSSSLEHGIFCTRECKNVSIKSNYISDNGKSGVVLNQATIDSVVEQNMIQDNNDSAIAIRNSSRNILDNNLAEQNAFGADLSQNSSSNSVIGNLVSNSYSNGIFLDSYATNNTIEKNMIQDSMGAGIYVNSSFDNKVIRNKIFDNMKSGVVFLNASKNILVNNNLSSNTPYNYYLRPNSTFNILRNTLFENTTLRFFDNSSNIILENTNNKITNNNKEIPNYVYPTNATAIIQPINKNILVNTLNMYVTPSQDYIQIFSISKDFNSNQTIKNWFEKSPHLSSVSGDRRASTKYILGSFPPDTQVTVTVNESFWNAYTSNGSGYVTFVYDGYGEAIREAAGKLSSNVVTKFEVTVSNRPTMAAIIFFAALVVGSIAFLIIRGYLKRRRKKIMKDKP